MQKFLFRMNQLDNHEFFLVMDKLDDQSTKTSKHRRSAALGELMLPRILSVKHFKWGSITMDNNKVFKDCIISPDGVKAWYWNKSKPNFYHSPGYTLEFVHKVMLDNPDIDNFIFSLGVDNRIKTFPEEIYFDNVIFIQSAEAVKLYNKLIRQGKKILLYLHSTC